MNQGFGDRVMYWTTINEANIYAIGGYDYGFTPPGRCSLPFIVNCSKGNSSAEPYMVALTRYLHLQRICIGEITSPVNVVSWDLIYMVCGSFLIQMQPLM